MYAHAYLYIAYSGSQSKIVVHLNEGEFCRTPVVLRDTTATLAQQPCQTHKVLVQDALEGPLGIGLAVVWQPCKHGQSWHNMIISHIATLPQIVRSLFSPFGVDGFQNPAKIYTYILQKPAYYIGSTPWGVWAGTLLTAAENRMRARSP